MARVAVGDIHGNEKQLNELLVKVVPAMQPRDTLVFLGDYIDRGTESEGCVDAIIRLRDEAPFEVVPLMGNHEQWMLRSLDDPTSHSWLFGMEGLGTIWSYSPEAALLIERSLGEFGPRLFTERVPLP